MSDACEACRGEKVTVREMFDLKEGEEGGARPENETAREKKLLRTQLNSADGLR